MTGTVQKPKQARTSAKSAFTKLANHLRNEPDIQEGTARGVHQTQIPAERVNQANEDLKSGLLVDLGSEEDGGEEVKLDPGRTES